MLDTTARIDRQVRLVGAVLVLFGGTSLAAATLVPLDGAVVTHGTVVVDGNVKKVQHQTGGVIGALFVAEGTRVRVGDVVARLDDTQTRAALGVIVNDLTASNARHARLLAERDDAAAIAFPEHLRARAEQEPAIRAVLLGEENVFQSRLAAREGRKVQLREKLTQAQQEHDGLDRQRAATEEQLAIARAEYQNLLPLRAKGLVQRPRLTQLEREIARHEGVIGDANARLAGATARQREIEAQLAQVDRDRLAELSQELRECEARIAELTERRLVAEDQLRRIEIRAPASGVVHELAVHTVGGVIAPGETLMLIVPDPDASLIEVRVPPAEIDQIHLDQETRLRFTAFNQRTTPDVRGRVVRISPNSSRDPITGHGYFTAGVRLHAGEAARLGAGHRLLPGMTADAYLATSPRTVMTFLTKPLADNFDKVFAGR